MRGLKRENFKLLALKVVWLLMKVVAYKKFQIIIVISLGNFWCFGKLVCERRGGCLKEVVACNQKFDYILTM